MFSLHSIQSLDDPSLAPYRTMRRYEEHRREGFFVAEGAKVVERLLQSRMQVISVVLPPQRLEEFRKLLEGRPEQIPVYVAEMDVLEQLTGFNLYQGVLAVGRVPAPATLEDICRQTAGPKLLLAIDGLTSAENVGILMRTAGAFGATGFLKGESSASPYLRRAVRGSMGAVFRLPVVELDDLKASLRWLREQGVLCLAAHPRADCQTLPRVDLRRDVCIVLGSEGEGISPGVLDACELAVAIPMANDVDSLNVAMAGAAFLYEASRQRGHLG